MQDVVFTRDAAISAFDSADGVVDSTDDGVTFSWDEQYVVTVDAPAELSGAFDTDQFYKIEGATVARPIKQLYMVGDGAGWYKKPAAELKRAAWSFDNAPFTLGHPDSGMVRDVNDIHGFWRNPRYDEDEDRLKEDLYVPVNDGEALAFIEENQDVSPGFYNRYTESYDGDTGDLADDDVDGFQVDMLGNHIAGVERGRCSGEDGCGLDHSTDGVSEHGRVDLRGSSEQSDDSPSEGHDGSQIDAQEILNDSGYTISPPTTDYTEDGTYYAIAPDENEENKPKYPIANCADVQDAWHLRGHGDYSVEQSTLEQRIQERARELDCAVPGTEESTDSCPCDTTNMSDENYDIPELSVDALAEQNEQVKSVVDERNELQESIDEMESEVREALDSGENFDIELDEDDCICDGVEELVKELDSQAEKASKVEGLEEELDEYREDEIEEKLDSLEELGAEREEMRETADEADNPLDALDEEIERREQVLDAAPNVSVKDMKQTKDSTSSGTDNTNKDRGSRSFDRGYGT